MFVGGPPGGTASPSRGVGLRPGTVQRRDVEAAACSLSDQSYARKVTS
jgi:hypothetical protein